MTQIIDRNPEDNPRLNQIYEILLLAGYFRIRIASLKAFDKIVGGIAWCITSSNFQIEVEYNDEMQIGQKIKVSEIICDSLMKMKCPYTLQPFQLQGLDVNNIYPIVQWLVKFVYETRFERQKYDRELSMILGKPITKLENIGNPQKILEQSIKRTRVNRAIQKTNYHNPVRVYSALLEYNDASATKMYNKLLNIMTGKSKSKGKGNEKQNKSKKQDNIIDMLADDDEGEGMKQERSMNQFGNFSNQKLSLDKIEKIIMENKTSIQEGIHEHELDEDISRELEKNIHSESGQKTQDQQAEQQFGSSEDQKVIKQLKNQNKKFSKKIEILQDQLASFEAISSQLDHEIGRIEEKHQQAEETARKQIQKNDEFRQIEKEIVEQLAANKSKISSKLEKLVEKRLMLKNKKGEIKKKAKARIDELNYEYQLVQASIPQIDQEAFKQMMKEAEIKKEIYDKKYEQLTLINQELAILQRKAQNYTSPPQIAQYHQRFVELFESINVLIEQKRSMFSQISNLQSLKKVVTNYLEILSNMKNGYMNVKKKAELKQFSEDVKQILGGLDANMKNSQNTLAKIKGKRESVYGEYMDLIKMQRDYLHLLRILKIQYENAAKYYK